LYRFINMELNYAKEHTEQSTLYRNMLENL
ncbi:uncharacterized protein METZ01_LOCUS80860, partial [marine metagenome]